MVSGLFAAEYIKIAFLYSLYSIYKNQKSVLWPIYSIMFVGFASTIMFGFTPSTPSMERMYIFFLLWKYVSYSYIY